MSMTIVNGFPCVNCSDEAKARRGEDPAAKPSDATRPKAAADPVGAARGDAVSFGGGLAGSTTSTPRAPGPGQGQGVNLLV